MSIVKDSNFVQIAGWMITDLNLSGSELLCYAIIYGFSQDEKSLFMGSLKYLMGWMNVSQPTVLAALDKLMKKGYIKKIEEIKNNVRYCYYMAFNRDTIKAKGGTKEILVPTKDSLDNNIDNNNTDNTLSELNNSSKDIYQQDVLFIEFWSKYNKSVDKKKAFTAFKRLSKKDKLAAIAAIEAYRNSKGQNNKYIKNPTTYIHDRTWEDDFADYNKKVAFYDILESDTDRVKGFKKWMREKFPDIENTGLPLSFEDGKELIERYHTEDVEYVLGEINREFYMYRFKSIAEVAKTMLQDYEEKEEEQ
jgi:predicted transcriptional regulator